MHIRLNLRKGVAFGPGRAQLLEGIRDTGSIAAAGRRMKMSYSRAWGLVEAMNREFRRPLVASAKGGASHGGAVLTPLGRDVLKRYRRMEASAARAVAEQPSKAYNPLFLYGGVGMGKTHLMHAIGHTIKRRNPAMRLSYVSAEKFTIEVINSLRFDRMISFRDRFHTVDVILVDDIQFIAGKERTQEEFFHTFNALYEQQKQIVISSDCLPKDINSIEERLRSRFEWGLIADIQPPDLETKIAILQKKAENDRFSLPDDVAEYIARAIKSNVRELEGALTRLMAYASLTGATISLATAQQVLRNIIASQEKRVTIDLIQKRVSEHFNLREQDLKVRSNTRAIAFPRQVAMYIVKQLTTASLPEIGRQFGGKHHTTVLHSINKIEELRRSDKDLNRTITRLMDALQ